MEQPIILIVDDSPFARSMVRKLVSTCGDFSIHEAGDGETAVQLYEELHPELTLLDLTMPGMDGEAVLKQIRATSPDARIAVVTADRQQDTMDRILAAGAFAVLPKPPKREQIEHLIDAGQGRT